MLISVYKPNSRSSCVRVGHHFKHNKITTRCKQNQVGQYFQEGLIFLPESSLGLQLIGGSHMKNAKKTQQTPPHSSGEKLNLLQLPVCFLNGLSSHWSLCTDFLFSHQFYRTKSFPQNNVSISWFIGYDDFDSLVFLAKPYFNFEKTAEANLSSQILFRFLTPCALG